MKRLIRWVPIAIAVLITVSPVIAGTIHTFANGEALTATNLNQPFAHIHSTMVGGHGARLVDADVNASAAIAQSKIANYRVFPRAVGWVNSLSDTCLSNNAACTSTTGTNVTSITRVSSGVWNVVLSYNPTDTNFGVMVTPIEASSTAGRACSVSDRAASGNHFQVECWDLATPSVANPAFTFTVYDDN